jgi:feruloyl esterase
MRTAAPVVIAVTSVWMAAFAVGASAADRMDLPVVKPTVSCEQLTKADLTVVRDGTVSIDSAGELATPKGTYCLVRGRINQASILQVALPLGHWTQRLLQNASNGGGLTVGRAGSCAPALNGELVVATNDRGGSRRDDAWTSDPQKRIDWAYQYNHITAEAAKALIKAFYGQAPRFSYFVGCSGGGREALIVVQRYPEDYDGVSAGAPSAVLNVHNAGYFHSWEAHVNHRADGSIILGSDKLGLLHDAALAHCSTVSAAVDGILQMPAACRFDPAWVRCPAGAPDTTKCLTAEEATVAQRLYQGASDDAGHHFELGGFPLGSEKYWPLSTPGRLGDPHLPGGDLKYLLPLADSQVSVQTLDTAFQFTQEWYDKVLPLAPLYNGANTNLRPFQRHGSKLILWHGAADLMVQPTSSIAYYRGVQKELGEKVTDGFMRFFLLPGVGHCGNGEGPSQADLLTPLMAWAELHRAPNVIIVGKTAGREGPPPPDGEPNAAVRRTAVRPYASPDQPTALTKPVYPFPSLVRYSGRGDPKDAASYTRAEGPGIDGLIPDSEALKLIGPDNQKIYHAENGKLVADSSR